MAWTPSGLSRRATQERPMRCFLKPSMALPDRAKWIPGTVASLLTLGLQDERKSPTAGLFPALRFPIRRLVRPAAAALRPEMVSVRASPSRRRDHDGPASRGDDHGSSRGDDNGPRWRDNHRPRPIRPASAKRPAMGAPAAAACRLRRRNGGETAGHYNESSADFEHRKPPSVLIVDRASRPAVRT